MRDILGDVQRGVSLAPAPPNAPLLSRPGERMSKTMINGFVLPLSAAGVTYRIRRFDKLNISLEKLRPDSEAVDPSKRWKVLGYFSSLESALRGACSRIPFEDDADDLAVVLTAMDQLEQRTEAVLKRAERVSPDPETHCTTPAPGRQQP